MRKQLAIFALVFAILGTLAGLNLWFLNQYVLHLVDWEGPLQSFSILSWLGESLFFGLSLILLCIAVMLKPARVVEYVNLPPPPPLASPPPLPGDKQTPPPSICLPHTEKLEPAPGITMQEASDDKRPPPAL